MDENPAPFWWKLRKLILPALVVLLVLGGGYLLIQSKLPKTLPSETHNVVNFDAKAEKIIKQGDVLSGKGIANETRGETIASAG